MALARLHPSLKACEMSLTRCLLGFCIASDRDHPETKARCPSSPSLSRDRGHPETDTYAHKNRDRSSESQHNGPVQAERRVSSRKVAARRTPTVRQLRRAPMKSPMVLCRKTESRVSGRHRPDSRPRNRSCPGARPTRLHKSNQLPAACNRRPPEPVGTNQP